LNSIQFIERCYSLYGGPFSFVSSTMYEREGDEVGEGVVS
jgi:hypothetical protein